MVQACPKCNLTKSDKDLYERYGKDRQYDIPGLPLGKYLKIVYDAFEKKGTLDSEEMSNEGKLMYFTLVLFLNGNKNLSPQGDLMPLW